MKTKVVKNLHLILALVLLSFTVNAQMNSGSADGKSFEDLSEEELFELSIEELLNLDISIASKNSEKISEAAGVVSVITQDDIKRFGGITLRDMLERVPGIIGTSSFFTDRYYIATRGDQSRINSGHNLILINGRPTREIVEGGVSSEMFAAFPVNIVERIEVIRGPGSVLYGSNAFSTVINIITKEAEKDNVAVTGIIGEGGAKGILGDLYFKKGDLKVTAAGRVMDKGEFETTYTTMDFFNPTNPGQIVDIPLTIPDQSHAAYLDVDFKGVKLTSSYNQYRTSYISQGFPDRGRWRKVFNNLGYTHSASNNWDIDFNVTYNYASLKTGLFPGLTRNSNDIVGEITNRISLSGKSTLTVGGLYNHIKGTEKALTFIPDGDSFTTVENTVADESRGSFALYSQLDYWVVDNLKLIGGFQANKVKNLDLDVVPRAGFIYYPFENINIKGLYGQAFRAASVDEVGLQYQGFNGNPNLNPEKVATIDLGVNYTGSKVHAGVNLFRNKQSNIIAPGFVDTLYMYVNKGEIIFKGIEAEAKYYITNGLYLTGSMLYQTSEDEDGNENVTPIANFGVKGGISYVWDNGITASIFNIYQGDLDEKYTNTTFNPSPGSYNIMNLYMNFDMVKIFNLGWRQNMSLFVEGDNILDKEIWLPDWGGVEGESTPVNRGRTVYLGLRMSLN